MQWARASSNTQSAKHKALYSFPKQHICSNTMLSAPKCCTKGPSPATISRGLQLSATPRDTTFQKALFSEKFIWTNSLFFRVMILAPPPLRNHVRNPGSQHPRPTKYYAYDYKSTVCLQTSSPVEEYCSEDKASWIIASEGATA